MTYNLVQEWFRVEELGSGVWVIEEPLHSEVVKSYLIQGETKSALIDTGMGVGDLKSLVESLTDRPILVLQSHAHNDHVGSAHQFPAVLIHESEADDLANGQPAERLADWFNPRELSGPLPSYLQPEGFSIAGRVADAYLSDGDIIDLGGRTLDVLHMPGHSRGGLVFLDRANRLLFTTDVVYLRQLYLLNPDSSISDYVQSLDRLVDLVPLVDRLYPAHGPTPIDPAIVPRMAAGMREVANGRTPDQTETEPSIEGGVAGVTDRETLMTHDFGEFQILVSSLAQW